MGNIYIVERNDGSLVGVTDRQEGEWEVRGSSLEERGLHSFNKKRGNLFKMTLNTNGTYTKKLVRVLRQGSDCRKAGDEVLVAVATRGNREPEIMFMASQSRWVAFDLAWDNLCIHTKLDAKVYRLPAAFATGTLTAADAMQHGKLLQESRPKRRKAA